MPDSQPIKFENLRFAVIATDVILFTLRHNELLVRLVAINRPPAFPEGSRGFPGGLIKPSETAKDAAQRVIAEKAGIATNKIYLEQLYTFSDIERDPRGRVVSVAYFALVPWEKLSNDEQTDTEAAWWSSIDDARCLAYDHNDILQVALKRVRSKISYTTVISKILSSKFTLGELERAYEEILGIPQDKRNFRKKIAKLEILKELDKMQTGEPFRPAKLYEFKSKEVKEIEII